ncbi:hypothetical protein QTH87_25545 [Variovorax sp. J22P168]|uniref:hypothetical protein n=1 Tax=Variovorax jilinensis TaxID=3053513 RepID=UPI002578EC69|nr:hypothetical protein [Variovorax sp. J22P168]MDM0015829.1 hypothetical protein [Variovorax sp. J22P168]
MCSHYQAEKRRKQIEKLFGIRMPPDWEPPPGGLHARTETVAQLAAMVGEPAAAKSHRASASAPNNASPEQPPLL